MKLRINVPPPRHGRSDIWSRLSEFFDRFRLGITIGGAGIVTIIVVTTLFLTTGTGQTNGKVLGKPLDFTFPVAALYLPVEVEVEGKTYQPSLKWRYRWIQNRQLLSLTSPNNTSRSIRFRSVDQFAVEDWVNQITTDVNVTPVVGRKLVDASGNLVELIAEARAGSFSANTDAIVRGIVKALEAKQPYHGTVRVENIPEKTEEITTTPPPPVYAAQPGEKWIDINLTTHTVTAYEGSGIVYGPVPAVSGHRLAPTTTGEFAVYLKLEQQTMRGVGFDGPYAETAPWIMYFNGDYALHSAPWRSTFVYDPDKGSHGCVNISTGDAKHFYDWAPIGTKVVVHK